MQYQQLKDSLERLNLRFFDKGDYNINSVWERTSDEFTNKMSDLWHIAFREFGVEKCLTIKCSTKPGLKGSVLNPITVDGVTGTAVTLEGQYSGAWEYVDDILANTNPTLYQFYFNINKYSQSKKVPYFRQIKAINYLRDGDKDTFIDRSKDTDNYEAVEQDNKLYYTHCHVGGEPINNWSLGCHTFLENDFLINFDPIFKKMVPLYGRILTQTILKSEQFAR